MQILRFITFAAFALLSVLAGIAAALRLTRPQLHPQFASPNPAIASTNSGLTYLSQHPDPVSPSIEKTWQDNTLVLPKASTDFVGYWGGYVDSSIQRLNPDLIGTSPDRVSVIFGRKDDTIFMASKLYTPANQKTVHQPKARMLTTRTAIVEYKSTDDELCYTYSHRFQLNDAATITYRSKVDVYDRTSHTLVGVVTGRATLKRLRTSREQLEFARPSRLEVPRINVSASAELAKSY
jgi:hypothetical protein